MKKEWGEKCGSYFIKEQEPWYLWRMVSIKERREWISEYKRSKLFWHSHSNGPAFSVHPWRDSEFQWVLSTCDLVTISKGSFCRVDLAANSAILQYNQEKSSKLAVFSHLGNPEWNFTSLYYNHIEKKRIRSSIVTKIRKRKRNQEQTRLLRTSDEYDTRLCENTEWVVSRHFIDFSYIF